MALPLLGLSLGDLGVVGSHAYNAKAAGEYQADQALQEEAERKRQRRRDALEAALTEQQISASRANEERTRLGTERIGEGLSPTPAQQPTSTRSPYSTGADTFEEHLERLRRQGAVEADVQGQITGSRERAEAEVDRTERPDAPVTSTEASRLSRFFVDNYLSINPLATVDELEHVVPTLIANMPEGEAKESYRLAWEGGSVNRGTLASAFAAAQPRYRDAQQQARRSQLEQDIQTDCAAGVDPDDIIINIRGVAGDYGVDDPTAFVDSICTGG